jgi:uncharacterized protein (TIGR03546 family)
LSQEKLAPIFTVLYDTPLVPFTRFNNSMVLGGLLMGLLAYTPVFVLVRVLVKSYRKNLQPRLAKSRAVHLLLKMPLVGKLFQAVNLPQG